MDNLHALANGTVLDGDYKVLRVLGAGGFGITYLAEEISLARKVAVKEYFPGEFATRDGPTLIRSKSKTLQADYQWGLDRFISEAQTLAKFDHPNVARVLRYFRANNTGYMVLRFEEGMSFKAFLSRLGRTPTQGELDTIVRPLLNALDAIHAQDFLHRDIAPDNIVIRADGSPVLIDFGSARGEVAGHSHTVSALVKPGYSPFEQYAATGKNQGPWTDIYALGATLYHAVTGTRPTDSPARVTADDLVPAVAAAKGNYRQSFLVAIDHSMRLKVDERPRCVDDWRNELFTAAERPPVAASDAAGEPLPLAAKTRKLDTGDLSPARWLRRRPDKAVAAVAVAPAVAPAVAMEPPAKPKPVAAAKPKASAAAEVSNVVPLKRPDPPAAAAIAGEAAAKPPPERPRRRSLRSLLSEIGRKPSLPPTSRATEQAAVAAEAAAAINANVAAFDVAARKVPAAPVAPPKPSIVLADVAVAMRPRRRRIPVGLAVKSLAIVAIVTSIVFYKDWLPLVSDAGGAGTVAVSDTSLIRTLRGHSGAVGSLTLAEQGKLLVSASSDGSFKIWDIASGELVRTLTAGDGVARAISASGSSMVAVGNDGNAAIWNLDSGERQRLLRGNDGPLRAVAYGAGIDDFVTAGQDNRVRLWNDNRGERWSLGGHTNTVLAVDYRNDKRLIASGGADKTVRLWDSRRRRLIRSYVGHTDDVSAVALSPSADIIASGSFDKTVILWSADTDRKLRQLAGHLDRVTDIAFSPGGGMLASASEDGTVKLWNVATGELLATYVGHSEAVRAVRFLADGKSIASAADDGTVRLWTAKVAGLD